MSSELHKRLTFIQDCIDSERLEERKRVNALNRLKNEIQQNERNRVLRERYGDGPYELNQLFEVTYGDTVAQLAKQPSIFTNLMKEPQFTGSEFTIPIF